MKWGLKETGAKTETEFQTEGEYSSAALDSVRKSMCFLSTKACKPILVLTQNKIINLKISIISLL